ncbi:hypothetical protein CAI16_13315 [Virgibacillus dokdonensis]|uniref:Uncharacterized protein n=1 Tax=Virgibacillus dokdonensis TaxID=302167 RepID=A0A3E0WLJ3_9BACI|nr:MULTISPECIES: hypothetical protein [Virgibacillus]RFA33830.1 hypothetical protein CAI16_13315 [Virgibacillus dokdonensis]
MLNQLAQISNILAFLLSIILFIKDSADPKTNIIFKGSPTIHIQSDYQNRSKRNTTLFIIVSIICGILIPFAAIQINSILLLIFFVSYLKQFINIQKIKKNGTPINFFSYFSLIGIGVGYFYIINKIIDLFPNITLSEPINIQFSHFFQGISESDGIEKIFTLLQNSSIVIEEIIPIFFEHLDVTLILHMLAISMLTYYTLNFGTNNQKMRFISVKGLLKYSIPDFIVFLIVILLLNTNLSVDLENKIIILFIVIWFINSSKK